MKPLEELPMNPMNPLNPVTSMNPTNPLNPVTSMNPRSPVNELPSRYHWSEVGQGKGLQWPGGVGGVAPPTREGISELRS